MSPQSFRAECRWLQRQPASVLVAYLDALTRLDLEPAAFLALQAAVQRRLGDG